MRLIRSSGLIAAACAVALVSASAPIATWLWPVFDSYSQTLSELAALDAPSHEWMSVAIVAFGFCYVLVAKFFEGLSPGARLAIALGGLTTSLIAAVPLPTIQAISVSHRVVAGLALILLAVWPLFVSRRAAKSLHLHVVWFRVLGVLQCAFLGWFFQQWFAEVTAVGLLERLVILSQALALFALSMWATIVDHNEVRSHRA